MLPWKTNVLDVGEVGCQWQEYNNLLQKSGSSLFSSSGAFAYSKGMKIICLAKANFVNQIFPQYSWWSLSCILLNTCFHKQMNS